MNKKIIVGITGGIGSGKSTICNVLDKMGYPVFYSDEVGRSLLKNDQQLKSEIRAYFGDEVLENGEVVRPKLGAIVFKDKVKLEYLNGLIHPKVRKAFTNWVDVQNSQILFKESAILFESNDTSCDLVCSVITNIEERINRVRKRDGANREEVLSRINNQMSDAERIHRSNKIIDNNNDQLVIPQILSIISSIEK